MMGQQPRQTQHVGLIGWPVTHSVSPPMHNAAFKALSLPWQYDPLPVEPTKIAHDFGHLLDKGYRGFNVTVPHKRNILSSIGRIVPDKSVLAVGATNTITVAEDGTLYATNTDWAGFRDDLQAHGVAPDGAYCLILGSGGAARAAAHALRMMGAGSVTFVSRTPAGREDTISYDDLSKGPLEEAGLVVNCTPVGMYPQVAASPWPQDTPIPSQATLYDMVYNPAETALMHQFRAAGARAIGGLGMLVRQGALSFEMWTGVTPPLEIMERAAKEALAKRRPRRE